MPVTALPLMRLVPESLMRHQLQLQYCKMNLTDILTNPGFSTISRLFIFYLDPKTAMKCRELNKAWRNIIDEFWWILQLKYFKTSKIPYRFYYRVTLGDLSYYGRTVHATKFRTLCEQFPAWTKIYDHFENKARFDDMRKLVKLLQPYFNHEELGSSDHPTKSKLRNGTKLQLFLERRLRDPTLINNMSIPMKG